MKLPKALEGLAEEVAMCVEFAGISGMEFRVSSPRQNVYECWMIMIAPELQEVVGGADDGEQVFLSPNVDIVEVQKLFSEAPGVTWYPSGHHLGEHMLFEGRVGRCNLAIAIFGQPFEDAEVASVQDQIAGGYRAKKG